MTSPFMLVLLSVVTVFFHVGFADAAILKTKKKVCVAGFSQMGEIELKKTRLIENYRTLGAIGEDSAQSYNEAWQTITAFEFDDNMSLVKKMIAEKDAQIPFWESLGFKIDFENGHTVPEIGKVGEKIERSMDELVESGRVRADQVLKPARLSVRRRDPENLIPLKLDENPARGISIVSELASDRAFLKLVADGHWPVGEIRRGLPSYTSVALHDLSHFRVFKEHPEFMGALRDYARARLAKGSVAPEKAANFIFEALSVAKPGSRQRFEDQLRSVAPGAADSTLPARRGAGNLESYETAIRKLSEKDLQDKITEAHSARMDLTYDFGGVLADGFGRRQTAYQSSGGLHENPRSFIEMAFETKKPEERRIFFARYLAAMDHTTRIRPEDWVKAITDRDELIKGSPLDLYLCVSGIFPRSSEWFGVFCN